MTQATSPGDATPRADLDPAAALRGGPLTPAGFQSRRVLAWRRMLMLTLNLAALTALGWGVANVLSAATPSGAGWSAVDVGVFLAVMLSAPWTVLGFWNSAFGLALSRFSPDPLRAVAPFWRDLDAPEPLRLRVAVFMALRNEDPDRAFERLKSIRRELDATAEGERFDLFVLSDTSDAPVAAREEALFARWRDALDGQGRARYRRREHNTGFKAGNVRDFVERWGAEYHLMLPLDADSLMSGRAILRMARVMQRHPRLGILQSLAVGAPAVSPFARLFQFGMRHGMRAFTMGSAWWQGDCGPYWGHNAMVRVRPFAEHCRLPPLPGGPPLGGHILSHDQVEAVLMRRAGYEVRVAPVEGESWEENPVTLLDFIKRERRWCNGNMQYWSLLAMPGLPLVSRFQLLQAIMMYLAPPAWMAMTALAAVKAVQVDAMRFDSGLALVLFLTMLTMSLAPKLAGALDVALEPGGVTRYGGARRFGVGVAAEVLFGMLMAPAVALSLTTFLIGLGFGRRIGWSGQQRDAYGLSWGETIAALWPQALFGLGVAATLALGAPQVLPWAAPVLVGLVLAAPFAVVTAAPWLGEALARAGLAAIPEEIAPPPTLRALAAISEDAPPVRSSTLAPGDHRP